MTIFFRDPGRTEPRKTETASDRLSRHPTPTLSFFGSKVEVDQFLHLFLFSGESSSPKKALQVLCTFPG